MPNVGTSIKASRLCNYIYKSLAHSQIRRIQNMQTSLRIS